MKVKKIKVTKQVAAKVPWYEKPPILFTVIAGVLLVAGVLMGKFTTRAPDTSMLGAGAADSTLTVAAATAAEKAKLDSEFNTLISIVVDQEFPPADCLRLSDLGPIRVSTLNDAAWLRESIRSHLGLPPIGQAAQSIGYGFVAVSSFAAAADAPEGERVDWASTPTDNDFDCYGDFEVYRTAAGESYLLGFVSKEAAVAINRTDQLTNLNPVPETPEIPAWKFWRKPPPPDPLNMYPGAEFLIYPDLRPDAPAAFLIHTHTLEYGEMVTVRDGVSHPVQALQVIVPE
jgi:hypothetical protein